MESNKPNIEQGTEALEGTISTTIRKREWRWIGHKLSKLPGDIARIPLDRNSQGETYLVAFNPE